MCKNTYCYTSEISGHVFQYDTKRGPLKSSQASLIEEKLNENMYGGTDNFCVH